VDIDSRIQALKIRVAENPKIPVNEIEQEVRELMSLGVRCRRFGDEVGLSNYVIYKIRKAAGISRPPRARKKFREVRVAPALQCESTRPTALEVSVTIVKEKSGLRITGEHSEVAVLLKGIL
jgi:hypothetical protein